MNVAICVISSIIIPWSTFSFWTSHYFFFFWRGIFWENSAFSLSFKAVFTFPYILNRCLLLHNALGGTSLWLLLLLFVYLLYVNHSEVCGTEKVLYKHGWPWCRGRPVIGRPHARLPPMCWSALGQYTEPDVAPGGYRVMPVLGSGVWICKAHWAF